MAKRKSELKTTSHTKYAIRYHIVWIVKHRRYLLLQKEVSHLFRWTIIEIGRRYDFEIDTIATDGNHVHLFAGAKPSVAPSELVNTLKSISAKKLLEKIKGLREKLWGASLWGTGYFVRTVGDEVTASVIRQYIKKQGKKTQHKPYEQLSFIN